MQGNKEMCLYFLPIIHVHFHCYAHVETWNLTTAANKQSVDAVFLIDMVEKQNGWTKERVAMDMWGGVELMSHARLHPQKRTIITR